MTSKERRNLNKERATATTMENCDLLFLDKDKSKDIIGLGMNDKDFVNKLNFLWHIDEGRLFENVDRQHLLPLISNLEEKMYRYGDYI